MSYNLRELALASRKAYCRSLQEKQDNLLIAVLIGAFEYSIVNPVGTHFKQRKELS